MGRVNAAYTRYFNKKYNYIGHLFQDRYFGELIKRDEQILETSRYIHLNPVRANMVERAEEYKWSSYPMYIGLQEEKIIFSEYILLYFNNRDLYRKFVNNPG